MVTDMIDKKLIISPNLSIRNAIDHLVNGGRKAVFIIDENMKLLGLFTNGDMRGILLSETDFSLPISEVMNRIPIVFQSKTEAIDYSKTKKLIVYPIVDRGYLVDALFSDDGCFMQDSYRALYEVPLVIMAGGKGTRLYPFTKVLPKALIPIGDYTVSERIIQSFSKYGCKDIYMILNHKAGMIKSYFNELKKDYNVFFETEERFLGTGGGLSLIKDKINTTFIVSNCDILIDDDLPCAYYTHKNNHNVITMVCSSKAFSIPYGVIKSNENGDILEFEEKPQFNYLVNTGVYVIDPVALTLLGDNEAIGLPDLVKRCSVSGMKVGVFPVSDQAWLDIGQFDTMSQVLEHFGLTIL